MVKTKLPNGNVLRAYWEHNNNDSLSVRKPSQRKKEDVVIPSSTICNIILEDSNRNEIRTVQYEAMVYYKDSYNKKKGMIVSLGKCIQKGINTSVFDRVEGNMLLQAYKNRKVKSNKLQTV